MGPNMLLTCCIIVPVRKGNPVIETMSGWSPAAPRCREGYDLFPMPILSIGLDLVGPSRLLRRVLLPLAAPAVPVRWEVGVGLPSEDWAISGRWMKS